MMIKTSIESLIQGKELSPAACEEIIELMLHQDTSPLHIAAILVLLRAKKESPDEISAVVKAMHKNMLLVPTTQRVLDIVGTGGDQAHTVNISTGSAILAASCGVKIAKHGNRAVSSQAGSADVLEALGIDIHLSPTKISECIDTVGIGFCFAPDFQPAMMRLRNIRKELGIPTLFNFIGPLLNPAKASHYLLGVSDKSLMLTFANILQTAGVSRSMIVHSNGLDELSCTAPATVIEINQQKLTPYTLDPKDFGLPYCTLVDLTGGNAQQNASILLDVFSGKTGAVANTLVFNAAVSLWLYGLEENIECAIARTQAALASGAALNLLNQWRAFCHAK